ncbi:glycosyltransferase family 1 protein [Tulasnella calospora MUT 4182]|uniref:Glycosyltransferase family 1 protein n=1 Tax=Tulasnella calospora MUT 4182 TaxID=1051891 RepID=A0A0C3MDS0_9AGAM|nr:glycosyltransferase family 1 protein [Tulasnella calospora MUT 4182]
MAQHTLHIVFVPSISFTHCRQMVPFIANLIRRSPHLTITVLAWNDSLPDFRDGAKRANLQLDDSLQLRLIGIVKSAGADAQPLEEYHSFAEALKQAYRTILDGGSLICCDSDQAYAFDSLPRPSLVIGAMFIPDFAQTVKDLSKDVKDPSKDVKFLVFVPSTASGFIRPFGPKELGGLGSWEDDTNKGIESGDLQRRTPEAAARVLEYRFSGSSFPSPDEVPMYDYELYPQDVAPASIVQWLWQETNQVTVTADGVILVTTSAFEPKTTTTLRDWYSNQLHKRLFLIGPQVYPDQLGTTTYDEAPAPVRPGSTAIVLNFLRNQAPGSVWFISFGTTYFPYNCLDYFRTVIKTLLGLDIPILLTWGWSDTVPKGAISPELEMEMRVNNKGLIVDWIHQQDEILRHPSIGVFLSHGGLNSMWEALLAGVLCVYWPFAVDQPLNAAYLTTKVRTGPGARPPQRGGSVSGTTEAVEAEIKQIAEDINGEVGERKRHNLAALREKILTELKEGGDSYEAIDRLIAYASSDD